MGGLCAGIRDSTAGRVCQHTAVTHRLASSNALTVRAWGLFRAADELTDDHRDRMRWLLRHYAAEHPDTVRRHQAEAEADAVVCMRWLTRQPAPSFCVVCKLRMMVGVMSQHTQTNKF